MRFKKWLKAKPKRLLVLGSLMGVFISFWLGLMGFLVSGAGIYWLLLS